MTTSNHWEKVYKRNAPDSASWYRPHLDISLALIERVAPARQAAIIDVGAGHSTLVDDLLARGYQDLTVLDVSRTAIDLAKRRLGSPSDSVIWRVEDITRIELPQDRFDVWHDRAVFHFLTDRKLRLAYVRQVARSVKQGGHVIVSTFGPEGPTHCSGLDVMRYDADALHREFGARFRLVESTQELHQTPRGAVQQFVYCHCRVD